MKYLIKIDKNSIQNNPDAGQSRFLISVKSYGELQMYINPNHLDNLSNIDNVRITSLQDKDKSVFVNIQFISHTEEFIRELLDYSVNHKYNLTLYNDCQEVNTMAAIPLFSYKYENTIIKCEHCDKNSFWSELQEDYQSDCDGGEYLIDNICPHCGISNCCELEFEKLSDKELQLLTTTY